MCGGLAEHRPVLLVVAPGCLEQRLAHSECLINNAVPIDQSSGAGQADGEGIREGTTCRRPASAPARRATEGSAWEEHGLWAAESGPGASGGGPALRHELGDRNK